MTGEQSLMARAALGVVAGVVGVIAVQNRRLHELPRQTFERLMTVTFAVSRVALWLLVFVILRIAPRGDISIYVEEAQRNLHHLVPYRDFLSSYAPFHSYMDASLLRIFHTQLALIAFVICVESFLLPLWFRVGRNFLSDHEVRTASILYLTSAISLQFVAIDGQDNILIAVLLALSLLLVQKKQPFSSGAATGLGVALLKFLPLLYMPAFFLATPRRWRWVGGAAVVIAVLYGGFALAHPDAFLLQPLMREGSMKTPGDIPFLIEAVLGITVPSFVWNGLLLVLLAIIFGLVAKGCRGAEMNVRLRTLAFSMPALTLMLLLFAKKSWPPYLMLAFFPICLLISREHKIRTYLFAFFGVVVLVEHSYYATLLNALSAPELHQGIFSLRSSYLIFLGIEVLLLAGYIWLLWMSIQQIRNAGRLANAESHSSLKAAFSVKAFGTE